MSELSKPSRYWGGGIKWRSIHLARFTRCIFSLPYSPLFPTKEPGPRIVEPLRVGCNRLGAGSLFGM